MIGRVSYGLGVLALASAFYLDVGLKGSFGMIGFGLIVYAVCVFIKRDFE